MLLVLGLLIGLCAATSRFKLSVQLNDELVGHLTETTNSVATHAFNVSVVSAAEMCKPTISVRSLVMHGWTPGAPISATPAQKCVMVPTEVFGNEQYQYGRLCMVLLSCT
jgi:hypothetical protein